MPETMLAALSNIRTVEDMILAFRSEDHCRRLLESMVWPDGRICPACGYKRSIAIAGRDVGKRRARPGLYQCSSGDCRFQFTVTTHTPLHSTKLPLRVWLKAMWLMLQSDKGMSSVRLAEALGVSQPTAWRMGHALRLMVAREHMLDGTVEIDHFHLGGRPRKHPDDQPSGRGRKGQANTQKTPVMAMVQRSSDITPGTLAGDARAAVVTGLSVRASERVIEAQIDLGSHLMSDEWKAFLAIGQSFAKHETVKHSDGEYVRDAVHVNSVEGFNSRVRRTIVGVFHHISPQHADLYFHEIGFRWSQRIVIGNAVRKTRRGRQTIRTLWSRVPPALQLASVFRAATGRQMRRSPDGGIIIKSAVAVFG
ncbi:IS1595 family transposase [Manganibacter manganicus]|uniref:Transposase n=1 Tax=Manganibacter manganicus TaxID=1873176 RepID=A0A1V8RR80_9HYPH|nr:IS1595 family transposase [Pseudaminobacter manganicus]OQM73330.1 transposase [Pseudaminobacter manganicus]OQM74132.1 transposase [Pseudaminobacter manganicus]OQM74698.1 transposase [Pseudaminobacter manganicus]OQM75710.1 transposase [Pseudaminobacter manganicus]